MSTGLGLKLDGCLDVEARIEKFGKYLISSFISVRAINELNFRNCVLENGSFLKKSSYITVVIKNNPRCS